MDGIVHQDLADDTECSVDPESQTQTQEESSKPSHGSDSQEVKGNSPSNVVHVHKLPDDIAETEGAQAALQEALETSDVDSCEVASSPVLKVVVENPPYPISLDTLWETFSDFGTVLRIITYTKYSQFQVLLEYPDAACAQAAKLSLDGRMIYDPCCTLGVGFSNLTSLNVRYNNDQRWDFTRTDLPLRKCQWRLEPPDMDAAFAPCITSAAPCAAAAHAFSPAYTIQPAAEVMAPEVMAPAPPPLPLPEAAMVGPPPFPGDVMVGPPPFSGDVMVGPPPFPEAAMVGPPPFPEAVMVGPPPFPGDVMVGPPPFPGDVMVGPPPFPEAAMVGPPPFPEATMVGPPPFPGDVMVGPPPFSGDVMVGPPPFPGDVMVGPPPFPEAVMVGPPLFPGDVMVGPPPFPGDVMVGPPPFPGDVMVRPPPPPAGDCVLLVTHLNPERVTPHRLFILFGAYGDVLRVKILVQQKEVALVQMGDSTQARLAMSHLNGQRLYGSVVRITLSRHASVQLPPEGQHHQGLTQDYSSSHLHRFRKPGSRNYSNIFPPSATLHLSNIPSCVGEEDLRKLFSSSGAEVKTFKFFRKKYKMALIQMGSVEEAIEALIQFHDHDLGQSHNLRVSFSKSSL